MWFHRSKLNQFELWPREQSAFHRNEMQIVMPQFHVVLNGGEWDKKKKKKIAHIWPLIFLFLFSKKFKYSYLIIDHLPVDWLNVEWFRNPHLSNLCMLKMNGRNISGTMATYGVAYHVTDTHYNLPLIPSIPPQLFANLVNMSQKVCKNK